MAFFKSHGVDARALASAVDPSLYAKTKLESKPERRIQLNNDNSRNHTDIEKIISPLRGLTTGRHKPLFNAAIKLSQKGLSAGEIEAVLTEALGDDAKITKKIRDANRSIKAYQMRGAWSGYLANNVSG